MGLLSAGTVSSVTFQGLSSLAPEYALKLSGIKVGVEFDEELADEALKRLYKSGYFENIVIKEAEGAVSVQVSEYPAISAVEILGANKKDKEQIEKIIEGIKPGTRLDETKIKNSIDQIEKYYQARGYLGTSVHYKLEKSGESALRLSFVIRRGSPVIIKDFKLSGNKVLGYSAFEEEIANKKRDALGFLWGFNDGKLNIFELSKDNLRIRHKYMQNGYLDAWVSSPFLKLYNDSHASLEYQIYEGKPYSLRSINVDLEEGSEVKLSDIDKRKFIAKIGKTVNISKVEKDLNYIKHLVGNKGYARAIIYEDIKTDESQQADISYVVKPGQKYYIRNVKIKGNKKTADKVIRRDIYLSEGHLYNLDDLEDSKNTLQRRGYFESVDIEEQIVDEGSMDLIVSVKEAKTGSLLGGIGYGSVDGMLLNGSVSENNLFGSGYKMAFNIEKSKQKLDMALSLSTPRFMDTHYGLGFSVFSNSKQSSLHVQHKRGFSVSGSREFLRHYTAGLVYHMEGLKYKSLANKKTVIGKGSKSAVTAYISFDNTDDLRLPRKGMQAYFGLEYAGLGGKTKFVKASSSFSYFYSIKDLVDFDGIIRFRLHANAMNRGKNVPEEERMFLGGIHSVRGYDQDSIAPISPDTPSFARYRYKEKYTVKVDGTDTDKFREKQSLLYTPMEPLKDYKRVGERLVFSKASATEYIQKNEHSYKKDDKGKETKEIDKYKVSFFEVKRDEAYYAASKLEDLKELSTLTSDTQRKFVELKVVKTTPKLGTDGKPETGDDGKPKLETVYLKDADGKEIMKDGKKVPEYVYKWFSDGKCTYGSDAELTADDTKCTALEKSSEIPSPLAQEYYKSKDSLRHGALYSINSSIEFNFPIVKKIGLRGSVFFDYGLIGGAKGVNGAKGLPKHNEKGERRASTGIAFEWTTPVGPLQFIWAKPLMSKKYDNTSTFEFSIGTSF